MHIDAKEREDVESGKNLYVYLPIIRLRGCITHFFSHCHTRAPWQGQEDNMIDRYTRGKLSSFVSTIYGMPVLK